MEISAGEIGLSHDPGRPSELTPLDEPDVLNVHNLYDQESPLITDPCCEYWRFSLGRASEFLSGADRAVSDRQR